MRKTPHSNRAEHGWSPVPEIVVTARPGRVLTRAEIAGLAEMEAKINYLLNHGDQPSDHYWQNELAKLDAALATQGAAA